MKITIFQPKIKGCDDSFFYDGATAESKKNYMYAIGDIRINNKDGELAYDVKERNEGFGFKIENDKDLAKLEEKGFIWENNNWFEVGSKDNDGFLADSIVFHSYTEALNYLKSL